MKSKMNNLKKLNFNKLQIATLSRTEKIHVYGGGEEGDSGILSVFTNTKGND
ncbi:class I lanthipeptide [Aquimarina gracilis]|uniref:Class I lanthipeptide n=1 Tax=Aquimarina gracilis TaxID=874422 RepID=A0ABU5ZZU2_9FLAO|nr:class I lanthipeptide [Aquimarina gracilis]MEB3347410.1 class I lanthipeptide [Aquimarina gracilis]